MNLIQVENGVDKNVVVKAGSFVMVAQEGGGKDTRTGETLPSLLAAFLPNGVKVTFKVDEADAGDVAIALISDGPDAPEPEAKKKK